MKFKVVEQHHSIKLQAHGRNLEEAFANIALALSALMVKKIEDSKEKNIAVGAQDLKGLLYIFLEEILFLAETEEFFVSNIQNLTIKKNLNLLAKIIENLLKKDFRIIKKGIFNARGSFYYYPYLVCGKRQ